MHSKFNMGYSPTGFIFYNTTVNQTQAFVANGNMNYDQLPLTTRLLCGGTYPDHDNYKEIKLQAFNVLEYDIFSII